MKYTMATRDTRHATHSRGFTLIELLLVISIMSMLASIVLASLSNAREKATLAAGQQFSGQMYRAIGDQALLYFDFDSMNAISDLPTNQQGTLAITSLNTPAGVSVTSDTSLYKRGKNLNFPSSGSSAAITFVASGIGTQILSSNFTFSGWYKSIPNATTITDTAPLIMIGITSVASTRRAGIGINFQSQTGNIVSIVIPIPNGSGVYNVTVPVSLPVGTWHHFAVSAKSLSSTQTQVSLYVDGKQIYSQPSTITTPVVATNDNRIIIGALCCSAITSGLVDNLGLFSGPLTANEIKRIYAEGAVEHGVAVK